MTNSKGNVYAIERFGTFDGPGIRYVLFLQGCPLQCIYCHNRDSWSTKTNTLMSVEDVLEDYHNHQAFYTNGGLTVSGGEALMQMAFVEHLMMEAKKQGIHTALDTSAACYKPKDDDRMRQLLDSVDLVLLDIKAIDNDEHKALTGASNHGVKAFLDLCEQTQQNVIVRHVLIPEINDDTKAIEQLKTYLMPYRCIQKIEILPYHPSGEYKWEALGEAYPLKGLQAMDKTKAKAVENELNQALNSVQKLSQPRNNSSLQSHEKR